MRIPLRTAALSVSALVIALLCLVIIVVGPTGSADAAAHPDRVGTAPALPRGAHLIGHLSAARSLSVDITLDPRDPEALRAYAQAVSTPGSPHYRRYLTVAEFRARFAPSAAQVAAIRTGLRSDGLEPSPISSNGLLLRVTASAATLSAAFHTSLDRYRLANGRLAYANVSAPQFSAKFAGVVQGVVGLDSLSVPHALGSAPAPAVRQAHLGPSSAAAAQTTAVAPCSQAQSSSSSSGPYRPDQIASAYGFDSLYAQGDDGAGQTVALMEFAPFSLSDIATYNSCYGIDGGTTSDVSTVAVSAGHQTGAGTGDNAEDVLDIEQVLGLAPAASVVVYEAPDTNAGDVTAYSDMVANPAVDVISTSWGSCEPLAGSAAQAESTIFQEAATEGVSVYAAAGDEGSTDCYDANASTDGNSASIPYKSTREVDDPGSQPWVTSVGGTSLPSDSGAQSQSAWNDSSIANGAGGGGISTLWSMPSYQSGANSSLGVVNANSSASPCAPDDGTSGADCREVPDVSADADPQTGYDIYFSSGAGVAGVDNPRYWLTFGGTSAAAPLWAAMTALANASSSCHGSTIGFADSVLYGIADNPTLYASDFTDVRIGDNAYSPSGYAGTLYPAIAGYDMATGLGTPDATTLVPDMCSEAAVLGTGSGTRTGTTTISNTPTTTGTPAVTTPAATAPTTAPTTSTPAPQAPTQSTPAPTVTATPPITTTVTRRTCSATRLMLRRTADTLALGPRRGSAKLSVALPLPASCGTAVLSLQRHIATTERRGSGAQDTLKVQLLNRAGRLLTTLSTLSNRNAASGYGTVRLNLARYTGQKLTLRFLATRTGARTTSFTLRLVALRLS